METELSEVTGLPSGWRERSTIILHGAKAGGTQTVFEDDFGKKANSLEKLMKLISDETGEDMQKLLRRSMDIRNPSKTKRAKAEPKAKAEAAAKAKAKSSPRVTKEEEVEEEKEEPTEKSEAPAESHAEPAAKTDVPAAKSRKRRKENDPGYLDPDTLLPKGWSTVEKQYKTGGYKGKTYVRFQYNGEGALMPSISAVINRHHEMTGEDLMPLYQKMRAEKKAQVPSAEVRKEKREQHVALYRAKFPALTGAMVCAFPGWTGEAKHLQNCGQNSANYYDPDGRTWKLLKDIEAHFGKLLEEGKEDEIPDIEAAKNAQAKDENGRVINVARQQIVEEFTVVQDSEAKKKKRSNAPSLSKTIVDYSHYRQSPHLKIYDAYNMSEQEIEAEEISEDGRGLLHEGKKIHKLLVERGFAETTRLLYMWGTVRKVTGSKVIRKLAGWYYEKDSGSDPAMGPCFQQVKLVHKRLHCTECHMFRSPHNFWKLGRMTDDKAGWAICQDQGREAWNLTKDWELFEPPLLPSELPTETPNQASPRTDRKSVV